jgi:hypothetical protein
VCNLSFEVGGFYGELPLFRSTARLGVTGGCSVPL